MESLGQDLINQTDVLIRKAVWTQKDPRNEDTGNSMWRKRKKLAICKPRRQASEETIASPWSWASSLQNCKKIHCCCLSHPVCAIFFFFFAALGNQYTTETSFYMREEKEFILLFSKTLSDASHVCLSLPLEAGGSVVNKRLAATW